MTKFFSLYIAVLVRALTQFLPRWKRLTVRARLHDRLLPFETVQIGNKNLKLCVPDRTCVYWAKAGPDSEPMTNAWVKSICKDETFVDIGANIGLYSLMAAAHGVGHIYAFEPNPFSFAVLSRNILVNDFATSIVPVCAALDETASVVTFKLGGVNAGGVHNEIVTAGNQTPQTTLTTLAFTIDALFRLQGISGITHLKIDVDGLELKILKGAKKTLSEPSLKSLLIEDDSKTTNGSTEIELFLAGYQFVPSDEFAGDGLLNKIFTRAPNRTI